MSLCLGCFPPSEKFEKYLESYIVGNSASIYTTYCWSRFENICKKRGRFTRTSPPSGIELTAARDQVLIPVSISLESGKAIEVFIDSATLVEEVVESAAKQLNLKQTGGFTLFKSGKMATLPQQNIFDYLAAIGGDSVLQEDLANPAGPRATSKFVFELHKQYFDPGELVEDTVALDLIFFQIVNCVAAGKATGGFDGALSTLAAFYFVLNDGKIPADFGKK